MSIEYSVHPEQKFHLFSLLCSLDKLGMHIAPSIVVFAAFQRILMAIPVVIYMAFTRYAPSNTCHLGVLLYCVCFEYTSKYTFYWWINFIYEVLTLWLHHLIWSFIKPNWVVEIIISVVMCTQVWCKGLISVVSICEFWTRIVWYCGCGIIVHHHLHICIAPNYGDYLHMWVRGYHLLLEELGDFAGFIRHWCESLAWFLSSLLQN
jgi:hypothetical protein